LTRKEESNRLRMTRGSRNSTPRSQNDNKDPDDDSKIRLQERLNENFNESRLCNHFPTPQSALTFDCGQSILVQPGDDTPDIILKG
jgi:hypothetical protein